MRWPRRRRTRSRARPGAGPSPEPPPEPEARPGSGGDALELLDRLAAEDRAERRPELHQKLVELRHLAFSELAARQGRPQWPPVLEDPFPGLVGLPRIERNALNAAQLGGAITHHGCLRVDALLGERDVARFRAHIDGAFDARDQVQAGGSLEDAAPAFVPFEPGQAKAGGFGSPGFVRAVDSPSALRDLTVAFEESGVTAAIAGYLGERPAMIANKWILRRTATGKIGTDFHQDGAFLGQGIRTVDCWIALSDCGPGTGRPGIDLLPHRFGAIIESGPGAAFPWTITEADTRQAAPEIEVLSPVFAAGDALFFDERLPHRTSAGTDLGPRHAIESWFVAPSSYPAKHIPVVL